MKKVLAYMGVVAAVCAFSCKKNDTPAAKPAEATITAADVTVEEGATAQVNATTNSSAAIVYTADNSGVYTVANGVITGVKAGEGSLKLSVPAVEGKFTAAEKTIKVTVTAKAGPQPQPASITIDGDFADWAALPEGSYSKTFGDEEATHPALTHCKVYADAEKVYVYVEWDMEYIEDKAWVPFHCYINTDGNASTGGYADQFSDACSDVLLEGAVYADGEICSYWAGGYPWIGEPNASGWGWAPDTDNIFPEEAPTEGAGIDGKYEFSIDRAMFAAAGFPFADEFSIGFDIQQNWSSVGILPNASPTEDNPNGVVPSLQVKTIK